ncbi:MAG: hypothetical protein ACD_58C00176G0001 [uncultured bacterium]|nr:MAG: hypothetical protein ACD_58C00176G0001 [uncultured bacterium]
MGAPNTMRINKIIKFLTRAFAYLFLVSIPNLVMAYNVRDPQTGGGILPIEPGDTADINRLQLIGEIVINTLLVMCGALAVIVIALAGVKYITAGGDSAKAEKAKSQLVWAMVGLVVISFSWLALQATIRLFGQ